MKSEGLHFDFQLTNYSINQSKVAYTITVYDNTEKGEKGLSQLKTEELANDLALNKLLGYAEKRNIKVYEMALIGLGENTSANDNSKATTYFCNSESAHLKTMMISRSLPLSLKVDAVLYTLCIEDMYRKYWYLYNDCDIDSKREFNDKVNKLINKVTKLVNRAKTNAA